MDKKEYIVELATFLRQRDKTMSVTELIDHLNRNEFKTNSGVEYQGKRGSYTLVHAIYKWLEAQGREKEASYVASAFPRDDGGYAFN